MKHGVFGKWTAIGIGFVGVLIALQPSSETLSAPALIAIAGSICFALMMVAGRALRNSSDIALVFWPTVGAGLFGAVTSLFSWTPPSGFDFGLLALLGAVAMVAHVFTNRSLILADAATVTPYQYTLLVWAVLFGWLFFNETPRTTTLIGAAFIVASGLFIFFREQKLGKAAEAMYKADWDAGRIVIQPKDGQSELKLSAASTEDLQKGSGEAREFPGGYGKLAPKLAAGLTIYRFRFVQPGQSLGLAFDGLVYINGHFAFFPKPFRILAEPTAEK